MWSKKGIVWLAAGAVLLALLAAGVFGLLLPYIQAANTMDPEGLLAVYEQPDGSLQAVWPVGENAERYTLTVTRGKETLYSHSTADTQCVLRDLPQNGELTVRVESHRSWAWFDRAGTEALEVTLPLQPPAVTDLQWTVDTDTGRLLLTFSQEQRDSCVLYTAQTGEERQTVGEVNGGSAELTFGETGAYPLPQYGQERLFWLELTRRGDGYVFYGQANQLLTLNREDFLGDRLTLSCEELDNNAYVLSWNETKGAYYEVQICADGEAWQTLCTLDQTQDRSYTTDFLSPFTDYQLRVVALGGQTLPDSLYAAEPAAVTVSTRARSIYSTVWPQKELTVYADAQMTQELGKAAAGKAFCVLEEQEGAFGIAWEAGVGYIDSSYCMINLPEYLGSLCLYNITNSYSSLYMVHEYGIAEVSGTVVKGYEKIQLADGSFVVPLLYPAAKKLTVAAQSALEQGYRLKIYDSFRPNIATLDIYELAGKILQDPVPKETFSGKTVEDLDKLRWDESSWQPEEGETWEGVLPGLTYEILMTDDGRWLLANFLAQGVSNHNRGVAMDLTMVSLDGKELEMQTSMHDLSWYSEASKNNDNAKLLRQIMTDAGFGGLGSEWWHYQDNEARDGLQPPALYWGVSVECWMKDSRGWRYRTADGSYLTDCTQTLDGISYTFDAQGYAQAK